MLTLFMLLAAAGGILRLALAWLLKQRWGVSIGVPQALAGALVVLAGLPEFIKPIPFPVPLGLTIGLLLPDLLLRRALYGAAGYKTKMHRADSRL
ncbi:hypothetical protein N9C22_02865 [Paracoccaceae bacterium]|nr:hypothetical protein [Paracoccaceae bacterium]MDA9795183.1 hypothetical protein [Paracoccaceae bacterium]